MDKPKTIKNQIIIPIKSYSQVTLTLTRTRTGTRTGIRTWTGNPLCTRIQTQKSLLKLYLQIKRFWAESVISMKVGGHGKERMVMELVMKICSAISSQIGRSFDFARNRHNWKWASTILTIVDCSVSKTLLVTCPMFIFRPCT